MFLLLVAAFVVEVPPSIGISNASVGIMREEMKTAGSKTKIGTGLKAEDEGKISGEEQIAATISSIFGDLGEPDHRRSDSWTSIFHLCPSRSNRISDWCWNARSSHQGIICITPCSHYCSGPNFKWSQSTFHGALFKGRFVV